MLEVLAPQGPVYQAGTLSANPVTMAAGLAVLEAVGPDDYAALGQRVAQFAAELKETIESGGIAVQVPVAGPLVGILFADSPVGDYARCALCGVERALRAASSPQCSTGVWRCLPRLTRHCFPAWPTVPRELAFVVEAAGSAAAELVSGGD